jgi:hypothetical protein
LVFGGMQAMCRLMSADLNELDTGGNHTGERLWVRSCRSHKLVPRLRFRSRQQCTLTGMLLILGSS